MEEKKEGQLIRSLGLFSVFLLTVSSVVGSGIYKKVAPMSIDLGSPFLVMIAWMLAGIISLCGALSNAEVAGMLADSGGEYVYFKKIYNKFFAFLCGWSNFTVIRSAAVAAIAYVFAMSFDSLVELPTFSPEISSLSVFGIFTPFDNFGAKALTIVLIIGLSAVNYIGTKFAEGLNTTVTLIVIVSIFLVIVLGLTIGEGSFKNFNTPSVTYVDIPWWSGDFIKLIFTAMIAAFWAYEGWSSIGYIGGEIKNTNRNLPLALILGVSFVMIIYTAINFTYLYILPIDTIIDSYTENPNTIAAILVVKKFLGNPGVFFISLIIILTTFGSTNSTLLTPPRLYYAMAKENVFFKGASYIHPKYNTPSKAIVYQAIWSSLLVLSGSFDQLTDMLIFASFIIYGATAWGVFVLRKKMPDAPRPYKAWGYPIVPALFILFCIALIVITIMTKPREALLGLGLMLSGIPFYFYWTRKASSVPIDTSKT